MIRLAALLLLTAPALAAGAAVAAPVPGAPAATPAAAVRQALALPGARAEVGEARVAAGGGSCRATAWEALRPVAASGQAALRFSGTTGGGASCQGFAWAPVRVLAPAATASRAVRAGEPLDGAVRLAELEVRAGHRALSDLPAGAVATRPLAAGNPIDEASIRVGPEPGAPIAVLVRAGALTIEQPGRALPCAHGLACAILPSGRRVEGRLVDGRLQVEIP